MKTIWKYPLQLGRNKLSIPLRGKILTVQLQYGQPQIWVLVNPGVLCAERIVEVYGTGHDLPAEPGEYVGTLQLEHGNLVFHVFDQGEK